MICCNYVTEQHVAGVDSPSGKVTQEDGIKRQILDAISENDKVMIDAAEVSNGEAIETVQLDTPPAGV